MLIQKVSKARNHDLEPENSAAVLLSRFGRTRRKCKNDGRVGQHSRVLLVVCKAADGRATNDFKQGS